MSRRRYASLQAFFKATRVSQTEIARQVGVSPSAMSLYVSGQRTPRGATALRISRLCNVSLEALFQAASVEHA